MGYYEPLLLVERVTESEGNSACLVADLVIGRHSAKVIVDLSEPSIIAFKAMPDELEHHKPARDAVIRLMLRQDRGELLAFPQDLSELVRQVSGPWPARVYGATELTEATGEGTDLPTSKIEETAESGVTQIVLNTGDIPTIVLVDRRAGPEQPVHFRFVQGVHPWQLTSAQQRTLLQLLLRRA